MSELHQDIEKDLYTMLRRHDDEQEGLMIIRRVALNLLHTWHPMKGETYED